MKRQFLTPNRWSRPRLLMGDVLAIAMHWVENPGTDAHFNWRFFEGRSQGLEGYGSTHFIVDAKETIWCLPLEEMGYHVGPEKKATSFAREKFNGQYANAHCIGIEMCHPTASGHFEESTLWQAAVLCGDLCTRYKLDPMTDIIRHFDVTGKNCPKFWVDRPEELDRFRTRVAEIMAVSTQLGRSA